MSDLIPNIDLYLDNELNVLLRGLHGVGKTYSLMEAAKQRGLKMKYYSCATLDPFTDLVGVPYPEGLGTESANLRMVRPRDIDEADVVMFDELNRAPDSKTLNAILEIVQFRTINGEKLPNLKMVWAAVNPAGETGQSYEVLDLDPALVDRFDVYVDIVPTIDQSYLVKKCGVDAKIAAKFATWYSKRSGENTNESYISPRRIEKMARLVTDTQRADIVKHMLPPDGKFGTKALIMELNQALGRNIASGKPVTPPVAGGPSGQIVPTKRWLMDNKTVVAGMLQAGALSDADVDQILGVFQQGIGVQVMWSQYGDIMANLPPAKVEAMVLGWNSAKQQAYREGEKTWKAK